MNRVMWNYTPDLKRSRMSTIGTSATASPLANSASKRRFSVATASVNFNAKASLIVSADEENVPPTTPVAVTVRNSLSQGSATPAGTTKRMSLHENLMLKILATPVDQPLSVYDSDSASEVSFCSSVGSSLSVEALLESDDLRCSTPPQAADPLNNPRLARLYKDLQSPSATTRIRALRALKSPTKRNAYGQFDVPHEEQDIITADERKQPQSKTIQDIMSGVCIYVEVRSGTDNRSDGIRDHVASLGAKVNDRLLKDTTHVIFKDGLLSTYQKAKKMNIPVVSILWIEACKRHMCLMNPEQFPISNQERYENPELFKKIRRQKSMQPRAEEMTSSGGKKRPALVSADSNGSKSISSPPSKLPVLHRIRKDDGLERILNEFQAENQSTPEPQDDFDKLLNGPMKLLERFRNSPVPTTTNAEPEAAETNKEVESISSTPTTKRIRKSLFNGSVEKETCAAEERQTRRRRSSSTVRENEPPKENSLPAKETRSRRKTMLFTPKVTSVEEEIESPVPERKSVRNRRKTMFTTAAKENSPPKKRETIISPKAMELCRTNSVELCQTDSINSESIQQTTVTSKQNNRATIYSPRRMEQTLEKTDKITTPDENNRSRRTLHPTNTENIINESTKDKIKTPELDLDPKVLESFRTNRRRTLYTPGVYDESDKMQINSDSQSLGTRSSLFTPAANSTATAAFTPLTKQSMQNRRRTLYTPGASIDVPETPSREEPATPNRPAIVPIRNKTLLEEYQSNLTFSSTKDPKSDRRKTIFDISMDIIDKRLSHINMQSKKTAEKAGATARVLNRSISAEEALKSPPPRMSSISRQTSLDTFYRKLSKSTEKSVKSNVDKLREPLVKPAESTAAPVPRKRKLFNAQPSALGTPPPPSSQESGITALSHIEENPNKRPKQNTPTPASNRRRSVATSQTTKSVSTSTTTIRTVSRRSTMLFETRPTPSSSGRATTSGSKPIQPQPSSTTTAARPVMGTQARTLKALGLGAGLPTVTASQQQQQKMMTAPNNGAQQFHLATTNLHAAQYRFVKEAVAKLGSFTVHNDVSDKTTHLVSLEPRRTINILRALARGLWIVAYDWVEQSASAGRWLPEEQFELRNFSAAVQICRSERQAFGPRYRMELFADCGPFYVSEHCQVPQGQLRELIVLCKGKLAANALNAKYLIVQSRQDVQHVPSGAYCLSPMWILDSISINKLKKTYKYLVKK
ncbi:mediator of DNA damage checkpoint protein 1 [Sabethes cyaneus]|uniref:mediator of DNA damage checkpoint protein 1 n=1 Tax=Sabethes cyaneus TaxID=53552 RepID=UPI00237E3F75|nr:mediator of DNA damage checkpoint protein 1 [Sabethes cyaneus]